MKEINENTIELTYEVSLTRINDESTPRKMEIDGKVFRYFDKGDQILGEEIWYALRGDLENILQRTIRNSKGNGNFKITFTKYIPRK